MFFYILGLLLGFYVFCVGLIASVADLMGQAGSETLGMPSWAALLLGVVYLDMVIRDRKAEKTSWLP